MGQFSVKIYTSPGSLLNANQHQYETGKTPPTVEYLYRLAGHGIDIGYLLTGRRSDAPGLSDEETSLIGLFARLSAREKGAVIALIRALAGIEDTSISAIIARKAAELL